MSSGSSEEGGGAQPLAAGQAPRFSTDRLRASDCDVAFVRAVSDRIEFGFGTRGPAVDCEGAVSASLQHLLSLDRTAARNLEEVLSRMLGAPAARPGR